MNVLGVMFETKLLWAPQVNQTVLKAKTALHAIGSIKPRFSAIKLKQIITANFY